jgi:putative ABC transport system permease protein
VRYGRKAWRDVRAMRLRAILLMLVIGVGIGTAAGIALAFRDVQVTRDAFYRDYGLPDLDVRLSRPVPAGALLARARAAAATRSAVQLVLDGGVRLPTGERAAAELVGINPATALDRLAMLHGHPLAPAQPAGAVVESDFATQAHVKVGGQLRLDLGGRPLTLRVRGLARSPEYLLATANPEYLIPQPGSLAVVFVPLRGLQQFAGLGGQANDLAADFPGGHLTARSRQMATGLPVAAVTPRSEQYSYRFTNADVRSFSLFAPVLGAVFAAVGFLLLVLSLRRLIHAQRRELGALLALGYSRRAVVFATVLPAGILVLGGAGVAAGVAVGVADLVATDYAAAVGFPSVFHTYAAAPLLGAAGCALATALLAALVPAVSLARLRPNEAMRGQAPPSFTLHSWVRRATSRAGLSTAYVIRTLLRRPLPTVATSVSLAAAIGLSAALGIIVTSVSRSVDASFAQQGWSYAVDLGRPIPLADARTLAARAGAPAAEPITEGPAQLSCPGHAGTDARLVGLPAGASLEHLAIVAGTPPGWDRIVLSEQLASQLHAHTGGRVEITTATSRRHLTVAGIVRTLAAQQAFLPEGEAGPLLGLTGKATSLYVAGGGDVARRLRGDAQVVRVISKAAARNGMRQLVSELSGLIDVMLAISLGVGALFLVSSLALSYLDREGEFATLRAVGYGRRKITGIVATESLSVTVAGAALAVPLALLIAWPLARRIGTAWFQITLVSRPGNFVLSIAIALVLAVLAVLWATRQVMRANIAATVRTRLIG